MPELFSRCHVSYICQLVKSCMSVLSQPVWPALGLVEQAEECQPRFIAQASKHHYGFAHAVGKDRSLLAVGRGRTSLAQPPAPPNAFTQHRKHFPYCAGLAMLLPNWLVCPRQRWWKAAALFLNWDSNWLVCTQFCCMRD